MQEFCLIDTLIRHIRNECESTISGIGCVDAGSKNRKRLPVEQKPEYQREGMMSGHVTCLNYNPLCNPDVWIFMTKMTFG